jgi:uncharacterized phage protein (TIGR01671 family)
MKREIKFRAWDTREKKMYPNLTIQRLMGNLFSVRELRKKEEDLVWMEYTGLKDKHGKEIYERDILKYHANGRLSEPIEFPKDYTWLKARTEVQHWRTDIEVIGNIYENPKLLLSN